MRLPEQSSTVTRALRLPRPLGTVSYVKLRDDPITVTMAVFPVLAESAMIFLHPSAENKEEQATR